MRYSKEEIGKVLRSLRQSSKMTQKDVAGKIGRTQQIIGHWETGYSQPDADTLFALCDLYGASVDEAFGFNKKDSPELTQDARRIGLLYDSADDQARRIVEVALMPFEKKRANKSGAKKAKQLTEDEIKEKYLSHIHPGTFAARGGGVTGVGSEFLDGYDKVQAEDMANSKMAQNDGE